MTFELQKSQDTPNWGDEKVQEKIVGTVNENYKNGRKDRSDVEKKWERCWKAFAMKVDSDMYPDQPWRSNYASPWGYNSALAGQTELKAMLMPNDENFFKIRPVNQNDSTEVENAELLTKYQRRKFKKGNFNNATDLFLLQGSIIGCSAMKIYWKQKWGKIDHETEGIVFDAPYYEFLKMQDLVIYPANNSDTSDSMFIHRVFRHISDVKAMDEKNGGIYVNTDEIEVDQSSHRDNDDKAFSELISGILGVKEPKPPKGQVELLEAWGDFIIEGKVYRDYVATVANKKHLIRFGPNPYTRKPFVFSSLREIPGTAYGEGFIEKGLQTQGLAETIDNMTIDELLLKMHGQYKYVDDGVFDPDNFEIRPGGLHAVKDMSNIQRIDNTANLQTPMAMKEALKAEFEETTTVMKYSKGQQVGPKTSATNDTLMNQASTKNFEGIAKHLNESFLEPAVAFSYELIRMFGDVEDIIKYTDADPSIISLGIPLSEMEIDITGLSTVLDDQQQIQNIEKLFATLAQLPQGGMVNWKSLTEDYMKLNGFDDIERYMQPQDVCDQVQQSIIVTSTAALQQQQMMQQQAQMAQQQAAMPQLPQGNPNALEKPELTGPEQPGAAPAA